MATNKDMVTLRLSTTERKALDLLALRRGLSMNKTLVDLIIQGGEFDRLRSEVKALNDLVAISRNENKLATEKIIQDMQKLISGYNHIATTFNTLKQERV